MKATSCSVSIIIPSYNSWKTISETLAGIQRQSSYKQVVEVIIVDSSDDELTKKSITDCADAKTRLITSGIKVMPALQRNIGAKEAKGDILLFIDSDAYPIESWVEQVVEAYQSGWLAGGGSYLVPPTQLKNRIAKAQYYLEFNEFIAAGPKRVKRLFPSCNLFCDRMLFNKVGGFPEIRASEDSLFGLKVSRNTKMIFLPDAPVYHIFRESREHYLNNQLLLGCFIYTYRRIYYNSFYYRGVFPVVFIPFFLFFKASRIYTRVMFTGWTHFKEFHVVFPEFIDGLVCWGKGFHQGIGRYRDECHSYMLKRVEEYLRA